MNMILRSTDWNGGEIERLQPRSWHWASLTLLEAVLAYCPTYSIPDVTLGTTFLARNDTSAQHLQNQNHRMERQWKILDRKCTRGRYIMSDRIPNTSSSSSNRVVTDPIPFLGPRRIHSPLTGKVSNDMQNLLSQIRLDSDVQQAQLSEHVVDSGLERLQGKRSGIEVRLDSTREAQVLGIQLTRS